MPNTKARFQSHIARVLFDGIKSVSTGCESHHIKVSTEAEHFKIPGRVVVSLEHTKAPKYSLEQNYGRATVQDPEGLIHRLEDWVGVPLPGADRQRIMDLYRYGVDVVARGHITSWREVT